MILNLLICVDIIYVFLSDSRRSEHAFIVKAGSFAPPVVAGVSPAGVSVSLGVCGGPDGPEHGAAARRQTAAERRVAPGREPGAGPGAGPESLRILL